MQTKKHGLRRELKLRDLVMIQVILIVSLTWPAYAAEQGANQLLLWLLAIVLCYVPLAAVVMKLSREIPLEGGAYQWVKAGITPFAGFMAGWSVTIAVVALYAALGSTMANSAAYVAGPHGAWMAASNPLALGITAVVCLLDQCPRPTFGEMVQWRRIDTTAGHFRGDVLFARTCPAGRKSGGLASLLFRIAGRLDCDSKRFYKNDVGGAECI